MNEKLKPCPCGKTPSKLLMDCNDEHFVWALVHGDCCLDWYVQFHTMCHGLDSTECMERAVKAWNAALRAGYSND